MIKIKIRDETTTFSHYGVSAKNGAPGRGSGRYPLGSGANPRSKNNEPSGITKRGDLTFSTANDIGRGRGRRAIPMDKMPAHTSIDGEYLITFELPFSGERIKIGKLPHIWKKGVPKALIRSQDVVALKKAFPNEFPRGDVNADDDNMKAYKEIREKYCEKDEATGLYRKPTNEYTGGSDPDGDESDIGSVSRKQSFTNDCEKAGVDLSSHPANISGDGPNDSHENSMSCVIARDLRSKGYEVTAKAFNESQNDAVILDAYNIKKMQYYDGKIGAAHGMLRQGFGASGYLGVNFVTGGGQAFYYKVTLGPFGRQVNIYNPQVSDKPIGSIRSNRKGTQLKIPNKEFRNTFRWIDDNNICVTRLDNVKVNPENISKYVD